MSHASEPKPDALDASLAAYEAAERVAAAAFQTTFETQVTAYRIAMETAEAQLAALRADGVNGAADAIGRAAMHATAAYSRAVAAAAEEARQSFASAWPQPESES